MEKLNEITSKFDMVQEELLEIGQSRSNFALVHFVVGRHGNLEDGAGPRMRYQALRELRNISCVS